MRARLYLLIVGLQPEEYCPGIVAAPQSAEEKKIG
jgi:hypothetical protein